MIVRKTAVVVAIIACLTLPFGCHLRANRSNPFSALTTPTAYRATNDVSRNPPTGFLGKTQGRLKSTAASVGRGVLLGVGLVAWLWLNDDDETYAERERREHRERQWKDYWRHNPDVNPAMTEAFKDDYE